MSNLIHNTAVIDPSAKIADDVKIGAYAIIGKDVTLESGVEVRPHAHIEFTHIGENTIIYTSAVIGTEPQDLGYKGEKTGVIIGKNCQIREYVTVNRASGEGNITKVGDNCLLMTKSHLGHNCQLENNIILANDVTLGGHVYVEEGAFLGGTFIVHQNCRIGKMAIVSGFSATRQDIPPFAKADGRPAIVAGMNTVGMKRKGLSLEERNLIKEAYKILFHSGLNTTQALDKIKEEIDCTNKHISHLIKFIESSTRGIIKAN